MAKIDIVSGFLGAGKTTLIRKLLKEAFQGEQVVLIENEFGEIGIDGGFLRESGIQIREMNSGCICCSLVGDFGESLKEVVETYHPDRILIEPSGVGKLSDVIKAVEDVKGAGELKLNSHTTVVDVTKCKMYMRNFGEFFNNQIQYAGAVILSRTDKASPEKVKDAVELLRTLNEEAPIVTTPIGQLSGQKLLETMECERTLEEELLEEMDHEGHCHEERHGHQEHHHGHQEHHEHCCHEGHGDSCGCEHHHGHDEHSHGHDHHHHDHHHHHADEVFTSWGRETANTYTGQELQDILKELEEHAAYGTVLRAKGMVEGEDGQWIYFDMVPGEHEIRTGAPDYTGRICVIGAKLDETGLEKLFRI